jgi:hypothetical protein
MSVRAGFKTSFFFEWSEADAMDVKRLFDKLYAYKNRAGFKNENLGLTKRDREIIKDVWDSFDHSKGGQGNMQEEIQ